MRYYLYLHYQEALTELERAAFDMAGSDPDLLALLLAVLGKFAERTISE